MSDSGQSDDGGPPPLRHWAKPGQVTIRCRADGPLVIEVPESHEVSQPSFRVIDHEGAEFSLPTGKRAVALCRCGQSAKKPFCDGSHRAAGFQAAERARDST